MKVGGNEPLHVKGGFTRAGLDGSYSKCPLRSGHSRHTWCGERVFLIASYYPDVGEPDAPVHRFAVEPATGQVVKISRAHGGYRIVVNDYLRHFVEINWRYHHMLPVLYDMVYSGAPGIPFADRDEAEAVMQQAWSTVTDVDQSLDMDNFWWHATWALQ